MSATVIAATCLLGQAAWAGQPAAGVAPGMLILRNGEVLEGRVTRSDDVYIVDLPVGQIRIKQKDVEVVCRDLEDGYRRKRATIQIGNVHHHLELAQWCLHHNLLGPAAAELADATTADSRNPMIAVLQRRLKMALDPPSQPVAQALANNGPSNEELDRMVRGLPQKAVESFTQAVQPVLLNHCTGSGCHSIQSESELRLSRIPAAGRPSSRRITQRNLYSVLKFVDRENPAASRLLIAASRPHGTVQHAIFDERQATQYRHLIAWVAQLADQGLQESPASVVPGPAGGAEELDGPPRLLPQESRKGRPLPGGSARQADKPERQPRSRHEEPPPAKGDVPKAQTPPRDAPIAKPADPFDPEAFNRRYATEKK